MDVRTCRRLLGPHKIVGVSAQTAEQAVFAEKNGASYLGSGAVFPTMWARRGGVTISSKDDADVIGVDGFAKVCEAVKIPVVSIGGVNGKNASSTIDDGASGIAVISAIFNHSNIRAATRELRAVVDDACARRCTEKHCA